MLRLLPSVSSWYFLLQVATAQSSNIESITTSLIFGPWDVNLSVVAVDSTATTYVENNSDLSRTCNAEAYDRVTIINGPSTAGVTYIFTSCDTLPAYQYQVDCPLTEANTATCNIVYTDENSTSTTIVTENSSELSPQPVTITAGLEKLVPLSVPARTTSSLSPSSSTESSGSRTSSPTASDSRTSSVVETSPRTSSFTSSPTSPTQAVQTSTSNSAALDVSVPIFKVVVMSAAAIFTGLYY